MISADADIPVRLPRAFFRRDPVRVARALLGQRLVSRIGGLRTAGVIVETEAYLGIPDKAAHTFGGHRTERVRSMWGDGGHAYVYFTYGMHHCMNVVAGTPGQPVAALIRALQPEIGIETMFARRAKAHREIDLCSGPAKLCQALAITRQHDAEDLVSGKTLFLEQRRGRALPLARIACGPRVGVDYAQEWAARPLRFAVAGCRYVSEPRP